MMLDTIESVDRTGNKFCGQLVLAAILGKSSGYIAECIAQLRRTGRSKYSKRTRDGSVKGTWNQELLQVLEDHGVKVEHVDTGARYYCKRRQIFISRQPSPSVWRCTYQRMSTDHPEASLVDLRKLTLQSWFFRLPAAERNGTYIVNVPGHWLLISGGKLVETHTDGKWVPFALAPKLRRTVNFAWRVI